MPLDPGPGFRALIRPYTGQVTRIGPPDGHGFSTDLLAVVDCENGPFFVKAMKNRPGGRRDQMVREKVINPFVRSVAPALLWSVEDEEWIVLGFELVKGRETDFTPASADLPVVVDLLNRIHDMELPRVVRGWTETRWDWFADRGAPALFRGDTLLHADINPSNLLIGQRSWVVDWSWPTRGAAFIDPAMLVVQLVAADHTPESAESWVSTCAAWANADPKAIDAFAVAYARMNRHRALRRPGERWLAAMAEATEAWATHRGVYL
ncbi:protein kinase [Streptomyces rugosispiralis]|uniref:Protein kinase n=1 Tax=Streptomyces rugosispiralis TaxID=2967341 RepID=A0ABT1V6R1_9ACTN|nr:protein kinase [Streptomyces rugosispiralis]MCQ8192450.1 protein kinase [Streptomyces rugosispiralis]